MGIKSFIAKIAGKKLAENLELEDGPMDDTKKWYKSKTVWSGIFAILFGVYETAKVSLAPELGVVLPDVPSLVYTVLGAMGVYSRVTAKKTIG